MSHRSLKASLLFLAGFSGVVACTATIPSMVIRGHFEISDGGAYVATIESAEPYDGGIIGEELPADSGPNASDATSYPDAVDETPPIPDTGFLPDSGASLPDSSVADSGPFQPGDAGSTRDLTMWAEGIGTNLGEPYDYQGEWAFLNNFHQARQWTNWGSGLQSLMQNRPGEERLLKWDGPGTITISPGSVDSQRACGTRRICYFARSELPDVSLDARSVMLNRSGDVYNVVDVEVRLEDSTEQWHPLFLERLAPFTTLRMLDWNQTNGSNQSVWSSRPQPNRSPRVHGGVSYEDMIHLANRARTHLWITVPHLATDDYVSNLAQLLAERLDPELRVIIEYSNEIWNDSYPFNIQANYCQQQGLALGLSTNALQARLRFQALRSRQIWALMRPILGDRMVRLAAGFLVNSFVTSTVVDAIPSGEVDAVAVSGYFYALTDAGVDQVFERMAPNLAIARARGLPLLAYEGGDHTQVVANARNPISYGLYRRLLNGWKNAGGGAFMNFNHAYIYSGSNAWGSMEWTAQPIEQAHRFRALRDISLEWSTAP